ncbi:MAG: iron uptake porin [Cyanobacteria bacterium J06631_6]
MIKKDCRRIIQLGIIIVISLFNTPASFSSSLKSVPSVDRLRKLENAVDPDYQDLQYLAQRYDCPTNLSSDRHRPLTRDEFAVSLNSCWQQLENSLNLQDLAIWSRLKLKFAAELTRMENIEADLAQLKSQQFSPTATLQGQVLFFIADSFSPADESETFTGYRTRLDLNTSFTGQDLLNIRLEARDIGRLDDITDTSLSRLSVDGSSENAVEIAELSYTFTPRENTTVILGTTGVGLNDIGEVLNPFSSSSKGALSRFGRRNPATLRGSGGAGIGIKQELGAKIAANFGYLIDSDTIVHPETGGGLFDSSASAIAQLVVRPQDELALALTYTHIYQRGDDVNLMGSTGLAESNEPFEDNATTADNFGLQVNWEINPGLEIGGWLGYSDAQQRENGDDDATILNGALTLAFPDLFAENNQGGIIIGVPPTVSNHDDSGLIAESTPLHFEALYRIELSDRLQITPGAFAIFNPDIDDGNTIWVGTVRTLFSF